MFFIGIAAGRALNGFLTIRFGNLQLIRAGQGLVLLGLGCAPIYPCVLHSTPENFGPERSQALIGVQMASAYTGTTLMAPLFGVIANHASLSLLPLYLLACLAVMTMMHERMLQKTKVG